MPGPSTPVDDQEPDPPVPPQQPTAPVRRVPVSIRGPDGNATVIHTSGRIRPPVQPLRGAQSTRPGQNIGPAQNAGPGQNPAPGRNARLAQNAGSAQNAGRGQNTGPGNSIYLGRLTRNDHLGRVLSALRNRLAEARAHEEQAEAERMLSHAHPAMIHNIRVQQRGPASEMTENNPEGSIPIDPAIIDASQRLGHAQDQDEAKPHNRWDEITVRNAKCDVCDEKNQSVMYRCKDCGWQICSPCDDNRGGLREHNTSRRYRRVNPQGNTSRQPSGGDPTPQRGRAPPQPANAVHADGGIEQARVLPRMQHQMPHRRMNPVSLGGSYGQAQHAGYHQVQRPQLYNGTVFVPVQVYHDANGNMQQLPVPDPVFLPQYSHGIPRVPQYAYQPQHRRAQLPLQNPHRAVPEGRGRLRPLPQPRRSGHGPLFPRETIDTQPQPMDMDFESHPRLPEAEYYTPLETDEAASSLYVETPGSPAAQNRETPAVSVRDENDEHRDDVDAWHQKQIQLEEERERARQYKLDLHDERDRAWWFLIVAAGDAYQQMKKEEEEAGQMTSEVGNQSRQSQPDPNEATNLASSPAQAQSGTESIITELPTDITRPDSSDNDILGTPRTRRRSFSPASLRRAVTYRQRGPTLNSSSPINPHNRADHHTPSDQNGNDEETL
ncbi:hypothetical protein T310_0154 [Rasamsonia emersonii CBS 393.64]|uniref:B box-type domain-containing protein n=1 Tax=Rasamsonia emersonii (strain ATCC 16479 / CBS 393.64 / IMI 116815) TaxID=1408163 RepID=A0A0F4Z7D6_RASE3|nr:hypothetical protein T310_0154 [Rasamsonia emersonii CBS 393.64]KKA25768.1 hypothetical protein T310_0154 [Rasamsonia emersonii CBS 393.64]